MPVFEIDNTPFVAPTDELNIFNKRVLKYCPAMMEYYTNHYYKGRDQNELCDFVFKKYWHETKGAIVNAVISAHKECERILKDAKTVEKPNYSNWWLITLTSKPEWDEIISKEKIDKYREAHFKQNKFKNVWVEEHGEENGGYHQHILVETTNPKYRFHTGINLKPTQYYNANINIKRVTNTEASKKNILEYLTKENKPQGNVNHFYK